MSSIWRRSHQRVDMGPRQDTIAVSGKYYDMYIRISSYSFSEYIPFLEHCFLQALLRLAEAGWSSIKPPVLHKPATEPHSNKSREWVRAEFPDPILAMAFYYSMRNRVVISHKMPCNVEIWNPTIATEVLSRDKAQALAIINSNPIREFTPRKALAIFPAGPSDELLQLLNSNRAASASTSVETIYTDFALNLPVGEEDEAEFVEL